MERESNPMQALCRSGCGFYGSPATDGLCSLCFKENLKKKQQLPSTPSSLSSLRDTTTAQPTISHIPSSPITDLPTDYLIKIENCQMSSSNHSYTSPSPSASKNNQDGENVEKIDLERKSLNPDRTNINSASNGDSLFRHQSLNDLKHSHKEVERSRVRPNRQLRQVNRCFSERQSRRDKRKASEERSNAAAAAAQAAQAAGNAAAAEIIAAEAASASEADASGEDKDSDKDARKKKNRCATCRKKVGLTGFECRCGGLFCAIHRYSDKHDCSFNYREMGAQEIRRNNPVVVGEKIQKI